MGGRVLALVRPPVRMDSWSLGGRATGRGKLAGTCLRTKQWLLLLRAGELGSRDHPAGIPFRSAHGGGVPLRRRWRLPARAQALVASVVIVCGSSGAALGDPRGPIEHEPIVADPANDLAFGLSLDGELPAAIATPSGIAVAPDPRAPLPTTPQNPASDPAKATLAGQEGSAASSPRFTPDTDTRRPGALPYSDPFTPSTAPFKRLVAFDTINPDFSLSVADATLTPMTPNARPAPDGSDELFFGDIVVDLQDDATRIPSVGPGARVVHARLGVGADEYDLELLHDSADNWFVRSRRHAGSRARLVLEMVIPRATFGGPFGDAPLDPKVVRWGSPLPLALQRDVDEVTAQIGIRPHGGASSRDTLTTLVDYFRGFAESSEPLVVPPGRSVYLALALSKKGVCRHRAYAFMVTATALGIRSRVVMNEAHAWVEVWDGRLWKRIDLGGAGTILDQSPKAEEPHYAPPPDPFGWPAGARRGEDLARTTNASAPGRGGASGAATSGPSSPSPVPTQTLQLDDVGPDQRPGATVTLDAAQGAASRGQPVVVHGRVVADGQPCAHTLVVVSAREGRGGATFPFGAMATNEAGVFAGSLVVPVSLAVGDYDLVASTSGGTRCGPGATSASGGSP